MLLSFDSEARVDANSKAVVFRFWGVVQSDHHETASRQDVFSQLCWLLKLMLATCAYKAGSMGLL